MITGTQPFQRATLSDTVASVLTHTPDWEGVTLPVRRLLKRCMEKNPTRRLGDVGIELDELAQAAADENSGDTFRSAALSRLGRARWVWLSIAGVAGRKIRISPRGGSWMAWPNSKELFYVNGPQMVAVPVQTVRRYRRRSAIPDGERHEPNPGHTASCCTELA
jgi:hypothetical protein